MFLQGYASSDEEEVELLRPNVVDPEVVEDVEKPIEEDNEIVSFGGVVEHTAQAAVKRKSTTKGSRKNKKKKLGKQDATDMDYAGPWAKSSESSEAEYYEESEEEVQETEHKAVAPTTELYGMSSYMEMPALHKDIECYPPKKVKHILHGHTKGVTQLRFFPQSGHLLLSSGNDGNIFLWDVKKHKKVRGFFGHKQAVTDVTFNGTGSTFLSCSFDGKIMLWDTESGAILHTVNVEGTPSVVIFNPNNENEFLVGLSNHRIEHYDLTLLGLPIQVYDHHLGAINSLTVVDSGKKFMSTSDDRTVRFWEWQINIPVKIIADPTQHSMPYAAVHPREKFIVLQTMDNTIRTVQGTGKFRFNKNKTFEGHRSAGYGIQVAFSADGKVLMSGDTNGNAYFWLWKTGKISSKIKVSDSLLSCIAAHPQVSSGVSVGGQSGDIYYCE